LRGIFPDPQAGGLSRLPAAFSSFSLLDSKFKVEHSMLCIHPLRLTMILQQPASIARVFGVTLCLVSTWLSATQTLEILAKTQHIAWWRPIGGFALLALLAFTLTSIGEWLWSFEEGWDRLRRSLRIIQLILIAGGFMWAIIIRVEDALHLL
jgi:hypothetical protein